MLQFLISGFILGLISSVHCVAMCGPIAFSLPLQFLSPHKKINGILLYNFGRIITYSVLGFIFSVAGRTFFTSGFQQLFSIIFGIIILLIVLQSFLKTKPLHFSFIDKLHKKLSGFIQQKLQQNKYSSLFMLGAANGLLPCGMVYMAVMGATVSGSVQFGTAFMLLYGIGTLPAMLSLSYFGLKFSLSTRNTFKKITPWLTATIAVLLILRGLNLGIPYLSPNYSQSAAGAISCH